MKYASGGLLKGNTITGVLYVLGSRLKFFDYARTKEVFFAIERHIHLMDLEIELVIQVLVKAFFKGGCATFNVLNLQAFA